MIISLTVIIRLPYKPKHEVSFQDLSAHRTIVKVDARAWTVHKDIRTDRVGAGDGLEVRCALLDPNANRVDPVAFDCVEGRVAASHV